jgi:hypothetical protein
MIRKKRRKLKKKPKRKKSKMARHQLKKLRLHYLPPLERARLRKQLRNLSRRK